MPVCFCICGQVCRYRSPSLSLCSNLIPSASLSLYDHPTSFAPGCCPPLATSPSSSHLSVCSHICFLSLALSRNDLFPSSSLFSLSSRIIHLHLASHSPPTHPKNSSTQSRPSLALLPFPARFVFRFTWVSLYFCLSPYRSPLPSFCSDQYLLHPSLSPYRMCTIIPSSRTPFKTQSPPLPPSHSSPSPLPHLPRSRSSMAAASAVQDRPAASPPICFHHRGHTSAAVEVARSRPREVWRMRKEEASGRCGGWRYCHEK